MDSPRPAVRAATPPAREATPPTPGSDESVLATFRPSSESVQLLPMRRPVGLKDGSPFFGIWPISSSRVKSMFEDAICSLSMEIGNSLRARRRNTKPHRGAQIQPSGNECTCRLDEVSRKRLEGFAVSLADARLVGTRDGVLTPPPPGPKSSVESSFCFCNNHDVGVTDARSACIAVQRQWRFARSVEVREVEVGATPAILAQEPSMISISRGFFVSGRQPTREDGGRNQIAIFDTKWDLCVITLTGLCIEKLPIHQRWILVHLCLVELSL